MNVSQWVTDGLCLFGGGVAIVVVALVVCGICGVSIGWRSR